MPKKLKFLDAGNFSEGESSGSDLDGFISDGEGPLKKKRRLRKCVDEAGKQLQCDPSLLDDSDNEQPPKRVLSDSSPDSKSEGTACAKKKQLRRIHQKGHSHQARAASGRSPELDSELEDDCLSGGAGLGKKVVVIDSDEEGVGSVTSKGENDPGAAGGVVGDTGRASKRFSLPDSDEDANADVGERCDRFKSDCSGEPGVSEIMKRMMQNRAKVLSDDGGSPAAVLLSSSDPDSRDENDSDSMNDFIIEDPTADVGARQTGGSDGDEQDISMDIRKLPDKLVFMIYLDFLMRMEFDQNFQKDFDDGDISASDCRLQAAKKIESKLCDLMDWAVESAWRSKPFLEHLKKHPHLDIGRPQVIDRHCEACNRRSNNAEFLLRVHGASYVPKWTIRHRPEEVGRKGGTKCEPSPSRADEGEAQEFTILVGRYCCARLRLYHSMVHFRWRLARYLKTCITKRMQDCGLTWEECLKALSSSSTLMSRLMGHYNALTKYAGAYVGTSLPRKAALRGMEAALCSMERSLDPSHSLTPAEDHSADEGEKE